MLTNDDKLTLANVRDGVIKYKNLRKNKLQLLCGTFLDHIEDLKRELGIEKAKVEKAKVEHKALAQVLVKHKAGYKELKKTIGDRELELRLDVSTSTPNKTFELKAELNELKETVKDLKLELRLEKAEALHNVELLAELKELKEFVFVKEHVNDTGAT
jgi:chromosome segregation ATPase